MSKELDQGCDRCKDYDSVREELEQTKKQREKETNDSLKNCEQSKKQLQKKLITIGAVAIVAATILGKEFVDKIASYIESFNSVKDAASKMTSMADPVSAEIEEQPQPEITKSNDDDEYKEPREWTGFAGIDMGNSYPDRYFEAASSIPTIESIIYPELMDNSILYEAFEQEPFLTASSFDMYDLTRFSYNPGELMLFDYPEYQEFPEAFYRRDVVVPEAPASILLAASGIFRRRRRS